MIIRKILKEDLPIRVAWMNDPRIYSNMHFALPITLKNTVLWYENNLAKEDRCDLTVCEDSEIVAFAGIVQINKEVEKAETYLFVNPDKLHSGIGSIAKKLLIEYAFTKLELNKLYVITNEDNIASQRIQEKFGYHLEGVLREEYRTKSGRLMNRLYYGLLRKDWSWNNEN